MAERYSASRLRANLYRLLDRVAETGEPLEIERKGRVLRIEVLPRTDPLVGLSAHPDAVPGDLEDLVHLDWSEEWRP